jgi:hypothetical protein
MVFQQVNCSSGPREICVRGVAEGRVIYHARVKGGDRTVKVNNLCMSRKGFEKRFPGYKL